MTEYMCAGRNVRLRLVSDVDAVVIARLRNAARHWFLDSREVTSEGTMAWIRAMRFPFEALLRIESPSGAFLGVIGWDQLCLSSRKASFGRLMVDNVAVIKEQLSRAYPDIAVDAAQSLASYAFEELRLERLQTCYLASNRFAERINRECGMTITHFSRVVRADQTVVDVVHLELTIQQWNFLHDSNKSR